MSIDTQNLRHAAASVRAFLKPEYGREIALAADYIDAQAAEIDRLQDAAAWIRTEDRLPSEGDSVLAVHADGEIEIIYGELLHETHADGSYTHWMPLPPPPAVPSGETHG